MSEGFTKLFSDIVDSSIWDEDAEICKVWVTLLALSNASGFVRGSIPWLANKSKVSVDKCGQALTKFESPDPISRTPDNDGRRIQTVERGWIILNHGIFRGRTGLSDDNRKAYKREWMRKHRASTTCPQSPQKSTLSTPASASVFGTEDRGTGKGVEVELPAGFPKTESEAKHFAGSVGCPEPFAVKTWNAAMARGGRDSRDNVIRSFAHHLKVCWTYEQERPAKGKFDNGQPREREKSIIEKNLDAMKRQLEREEANEHRL